MEIATNEGTFIQNLKIIQCTNDPVDHKDLVIELLFKYSDITISEYLVN